MKKSILVASTILILSPGFSQSNLSNFVFRQNISTNSSAELINPQEFPAEELAAQPAPKEKKTKYTDKQVSTIIKGLLTNQDIDNSNVLPINDDNKGHSTAAKKYLKENPHKIKYIRSSLTRSVQNRKEPTPEEIAQLKPLNSQDDEIPFVTFEVTYIPLGDSIMPLQQHIGSYVRNSSDLALQEVQYRITEDGKYEFKDHREVVEFKRNKKTVTDGFRPITERTFYLQTKRKGLLLEELTYGEFKDMTVSEQRVAFSGSEVEEPIYIASAINDENAEFFEKLPTDAEKHKVEFELEEVMTFKYRDESLVDFAEKKYKEKKEKAGKGQEVETKEEIVLERNNERWMVGFNMMDLITHRVKYENMNEARNPVAVNTNPNYN